MPRTKKALKQTVKRMPYIRRLVAARDSLSRRVEALGAEKQQLIEDTRLMLSHKYLRGDGIEIGALHMPLPLPPHAKAKYVDYIPVKKLREQYPELKELSLVNVDIVDDGEKLSKVKNSSQDFIIANHMLEHCQDPIGTIINFYKKLRPGGIMYMAVPDMRYTFDMHRPLTKYSHLLEEHKIYPSKKYYAVHTREVVKLTEGVKQKKALEERTQELVKMKYSIHYHVWTQRDLVDFFNKTAKKFSLEIEIEAMANNIHEVVFIVRKRDAKVESGKIKSIAKHYFG